MEWILFLMGFVLNCTGVIALYATPLIIRDGRSIDASKFNAATLLSFALYFAALVYNFIW